MFIYLWLEKVTHRSEIFDWARRLSGWRSVPRGHYLINNRNFRSTIGKTWQGITRSDFVDIAPGQTIPSIIQQFDRQSFMIRVIS